MRQKAQSRITKKDKNFSWTPYGQYILEEAIESQTPSQCSIVVTQPRKISAVSIAERMAFERGEEVGESVGYSVRFESRLPRFENSFLKFSTIFKTLKKI